MRNTMGKGNITVDQAINAIAMRKRNQKYLLRLIREGNYSRASLAEVTGLTKASITKLTNQLLEKKLITEEESDSVGVGRKPIILKIRGEARSALAISIDRKCCSFGIINLAGEVLAEDTFSISHSMSPEGVMAKVVSGLKKQLETTKADTFSELLGIGVIVSGPVDTMKNKIMRAPMLEAWAEFDFEECLKDFHLPIRMENDANAYAIFDQCFGKGRDVNDFISVLFVHGIGAGIILNGKLYHGFHGYCNELGHISIDYRGKQCLCGNRGCLVTYAGRESILKGTPYKNWFEVIDADDEAIIEMEAEYLATALATVLNLLGIKKVIMHGELCYKGEIIAKRISAKLSERILTQDHISVEVGEARNDILVGGSLLISDFFNKEVD